MTILFILSFAINLVLIWYLKQIVQRFLRFQDESTRLLEIIEQYSEHINRVYELPTFYGDTTIKSLLDHTGFLKRELGVLKTLFDFDAVPREGDETNEEKEE